MGAAAVVGGAVVAAGASAYSANQQKKAAKSAAKSSADATAYATDVQREMFDEQVARIEPFYQNALAADNLLAGYLGLNQDFGPLTEVYGQWEPFSFQADPGYDFRKNEGYNALNAMASARGGLQSGAALKAAQRFGQDLASQEYQAAYGRWNNDQTQKYNRWTTDWSNIYNRLSNLSGRGLAAASGVGQAGQNFASTSGNLALNNAATQGNAAMSMANANSSMASGFANALGGATGSMYSSPGMWNAGNALGGNFGPSGSWVNPDTGQRWRY